MGGPGGYGCLEQCARCRGKQKLFLTQMIKHLGGAITMAQKEIENGDFPATIILAETIATTQQIEIHTMNQILASLG